MLNFLKITSIKGIINRKTCMANKTRYKKECIPSNPLVTSAANRINGPVHLITLWDRKAKAVPDHGGHKSRNEPAEILKVTC